MSVWLIVPIGISESQIRLKLAEEEAAEIVQGKAESVVHEEIPPSVLISQGLENEELQ